MYKVFNLKIEQKNLFSFFSSCRYKLIWVNEFYDEELYCYRLVFSVQISRLNLNVALLLKSMELNQETTI